MPVTESVYKEFGQVLQRARKRLGLTQQQVAWQVGLSRPSIVNIEAGRQRIALHQALELCQLLRIRLALREPRLKRNTRLA